MITYNYMYVGRHLIHKKNYLYVFILYVIIIMLSFLLHSYPVSAYSITVTTSGAQSIDILHTRTVISSDNVRVVTDCHTGYNLYLSTTVNDNRLYMNGLSANNTNGTFFSPSDGTTDLASADNTWGYYVPTNGSSAPTTSSIFNAVPTLNSPVTLKTTSQTASESDIDDSFPVYYGVNASSDLPVGNYKMIKDGSDNDGTLTYFAVTPLCSPFTIVYNGNNSDSGTNMSVEHDNVMVGDEVDLYASNYKKAGYGFAGWSTEQLDPESATFAADFSDAVSEGLVFGPNETITLDTNLAGKGNMYNILTLYAVWVKPTGNMQGWVCPKNTTMPIGSVVALTDQRDNQVYAVAKLADGNCWMIENMRLSTTGSNDESKAQGFSGVFHGLANSENTGFITSTAANSLYSIDGSTAYTITGSSQGYRFPRHNNSNTVSAVANMTSGDQNIYGYGNYYSFSAANATTEDSSTTPTTINGSSICPTDWDTPIGGQTTLSSSFGALSAALGGPSDGSAIASTTAAEQLSASFRSFPNNFVYSGRYNDSAVGSKTTIGAYWSRTGTNSSANYFYLADNDVRPATSTVNRGRGNSMRCVNAPKYHIVFDKNANDATGAGASGYTYTYKGGFSWDATRTFTALKAQNFKRDGYGFAGWSTDPNVASHINEANRSYIYGAEEIIYTSDDNLVAAADENNIIKLYAVWVPSTGNLQNWSGCNSLSTNNVVALTDTRDNQVYAVAKLADGKCWMIENSRLHPGTANITSVNTNSPTSSFISEARAIGDNTTEFCDDYSSQQCTESVRFNTDNINSLNTESGWAMPRYGHGAYYNWYTATAGNGKMNIWPAFGDLCPAGWHLPSHETNEFATLMTYIGTQEKYSKFPANLAASGIIDNNHPSKLDDTNFLHTSSSSNTAGNYVLFYHNFLSTGLVVETEGDAAKIYGIPFRCLAY